MEFVVSVPLIIFPAPILFQHYKLNPAMIKTKLWIQMLDSIYRNTDGRCQAVSCILQFTTVKEQTSPVPKLCAVLKNEI